MEEFIERLYTSEEDINKTVLDILRVLVAFNGVIWRSEIFDSILKVRRGHIDYLPTPDLVEEAIKILKEKNIVKVEERPRGDLASGRVIKDLLIKLRDPHINTLMLRDEVLREYRALVSGEIQKAIKNMGN